MMILVFLILGLAWVLSFLLTIRGPTLIDRAAGADVLTSVMASFFLLMGILTQSSRLFVDVAMLMVGGGFLVMIFLAKLHEKGES